MAAGTVEGAVHSSGPPAALRGPSLVSRAGPLVLARFVSACLTVSIPLALARSMALADFGTYKQLFLISQTLYFVLPFGVPQSLYFFIPRSEEKRTFLGQTLLFLLGAGCAAGVALWAFGPTLAHALNNPGLIAYRTDLALYTGLTIGAFSLELSLTCQGKTKAAAAIYLGSDS
ncbi:MAG: polysaccharide biosynthesis protein, partial [Myxococcaceae bacterium]